MSLPSSVSLRSSSVDTSSLFAAPSRDPQPSDAPTPFERHLDDASKSEDQNSASDHINDRNERDAKKADRRDDSTNTRSSKNDKTDDTNSATPLVVAALPVETPVDVKKQADAATPAATVEPAKGKDDSVPELVAAPVDAKPADAALAAKPDEKTDKLVVPLIASKDGVEDIKDTKTSAEAPKEKAADTVLPQAALVESAPAPINNSPARKSEAKSASPQIKAAALPAPAAAPAPIAPSTETALAETGAATQTNADQGANADDAGTDAQGKLKEGLGHQAATQMAEKSNSKDNAGGQTSAAPTATPQASATPAQTAATFAAKIAQAMKGDGMSISPTGSAGTAQGATVSGETGSLPQSQNQNASTATIRIGTLPGQSQPTQVPAMAIALQMARNLQKGVNRFDIRLDPAEMGRIDVRMEVRRDGHVAAHLTVERPQTLDLLQRDAGALQQALNDAGLQANADSLNFSLRDQDGQNGQTLAANDSGMSASASSSAAEDVVAGPIYNINLSANGGIDIRV